jgi:hypothetical protein
LPCTKPEPGVAASHREYGARGARARAVERGRRRRARCRCLPVNSRPTEYLRLNAEIPLRDYDTGPRPSLSRRWSSPTTRSAPKESEPLDIKRQTLDLEASYTPFQFASLNFGYSREDADRTFRIYEKTAENIVRASIDSTGNQAAGSSGHREILPHGFATISRCLRKSANRPR